MEFPTARPRVFVTVTDGPGPHLVSIVERIEGYDPRVYLTILTPANAVAARLAALTAVRQADSHVLALASDDWLCLCSNTVSDAGFYTCTAEGVDAEPTTRPAPGEPVWDGIHVKCYGCGRIMAQPEGEYIDTAHLVPVVGQVAL